MIPGLSPPRPLGVEPPSAPELRSIALHIPGHRPSVGLAWAVPSKVRLLGQSLDVGACGPRVRARGPLLCASGASAVSIYSRR